MALVLVAGADGERGRELKLYLDDPVVPGAVGAIMHQVPKQ